MKWLSGSLWLLCSSSHREDNINKVAKHSASFLHVSVGFLNYIQNGQLALLRLCAFSIFINTQRMEGVS